MHKLPWRTAWITGASTGIGRALALQLAQSGVHVTVSARSADKLAAVAAASPNITAYPADVTDGDSLKRCVAAIHAAAGDIDLAVLNAGAWQPVEVDDFRAEVFQETMDVNYLGVVRGIEAVLPGMLARRAGQIVIVASVAGYRGLPRAGAYGPSKAALIALAESLRPDLAAHGITVTLVNPGFVATPLTAKNDFAMPFMIAADDAARRMLRGMASGRFEVAFPWQLVAILKVARLLPYRLFFWLIGRTLRRGK